jgi:uncharacterized protein (TIGR03032 family)
MSEPAASPPPETAAAQPPPLRSVHTASFAEILRQFRISLLVSTYQAGKLVILRAGPDGGVNTHFRGFNKPMGVAAAGDRLAVGTALEIWEFHNVPAVAEKLEPAGRHDACYLPRAASVTGNVQIHEMVWAGGELWFVNTRFSCLSTPSSTYSFVPRWRPPFISALAPDDRCHLNGIGLRDGQPRYVTALGATDAPAGWRENKKQGGVLMDLASNAILAGGLSMPHSPRWYDGRLWLLESGTGTLGLMDLRAGKYEPVAEMPGFTRGLDFCGPLAFVGLSQVRETAIFSGIAITERPVQRQCGVWVVDLPSGRIAAFLRFEEAVQEIFSVQVLPGYCFPDVINDDPPRIADSFVLPDQALGDVPQPLRR